MRYDFDLLSYLISFIFLAGIIVLLKKKYKKDNVYVLFFSVFYFYIINVIKLTIFPITIGTPLVEELQKLHTFTSGFNLVPFTNTSLEQIVLNILLTIPFGFGIRYIKQMKFHSVIMWGVVFSFLIEMTQFLISLMIGYYYRVIDVNDLLTNTLGVLIGQVLFVLFSKFIVYFLETKNKIHLDSEEQSLLSYIHRTAKN